MSNMTLEEIIEWDAAQAVRNNAIKKANKKLTWRERIALVALWKHKTAAALQAIRIIVMPNYALCGRCGKPLDAMHGTVRQVTFKQDAKTKRGYRIVKRGLVHERCLPNAGN